MQRSFNILMLYSCKRKINGYILCVLTNSDLEISEAENKRLRMELDQMRTHYESDMEVLKKQNNSLLEDCERYREVGWIYLTFTSVLMVSLSVLTYFINNTVVKGATA